MSTALVSQQPASQWDSREMIETLKATVCKGATDAQFKMFVEVCKATGLNPFLNEIYFVPAVGVMAARDGYLRIANENPQFDGMETLVQRDDKGIPIKATCKVWRKDRAHPITCEAYYDEYRKDSQIWRTYRSAMISKVAEVLALKRSFSINGVVTEDEIGSEEERGSKEAQAEVAQRRIAELKGPQALNPEGVIALGGQCLPDRDYEERHKALILEAANALDAPRVFDHTEGQIVEQPKAKAKPKGTISFEALKAWGELKAELRQLTGTDALYYSGLAAKGYEHANQIATKKDALDIWKVLSTERVRIKGEMDLIMVLKNAHARLGMRFMDILGAHGAEAIEDVLKFGGDSLQTLLAELKQAVDDQAK